MSSRISTIDWNAEAGRVVGWCADQKNVAEALREAYERGRDAERVRIAALMRQVPPAELGGLVVRVVGKCANDDKSYIETGEALRDALMAALKVSDV